MKEAAQNRLVFQEGVALKVTLDVDEGVFVLEWHVPGSEDAFARGRLFAGEPGGVRRVMVVQWELEIEGKIQRDFANEWAASTRALVRRIRKLFPVADGAVKIGILSKKDLGKAQAGRWLPIELPPERACWDWLEREVREYAKLVRWNLERDFEPAVNGPISMHLLACALLGVPPSHGELATIVSLLDLEVTFNQIKECAEFAWFDPHSKERVAGGCVRCSGMDELTWELEQAGRKEASVSSHDRNSIRSVLERWLKELKSNPKTFGAFWVERKAGSQEGVRERERPFEPETAAYSWVEDNVVAMAEALRFQFSPVGKIMSESPMFGDFVSYERRLLRKEQKRVEEETRRRETMARLAQEREEREERREEKRRQLEREKRIAESKAGSNAAKPAITSSSFPSLPVHFEMPEFELQETAFSLGDLKDYFLRERAALWWVSNQSDDLLCLPHCRIERLEYQIRTALRVLGPLRGRALLSDEVGLGKTIEAGLIIKELLTRGMAKRFLVLTTPSLVEQWEEELNEKFGFCAATTNDPRSKSDARGFWMENAQIVASLHTVKQPAHLEVAREVHWDVLIVDEAHYLRNRDSQAWQAVNALPRQFLLLLTATPVQNSLEELYNLITLLQPGQLPAPKEFRARFIDPKRPRQPREPEELRRLLGQVMIRNTRANAGVKLPPRRAETVLFESEEREQGFWQKWEGEFRQQLAGLSRSQSSLWGRLVLQTAGSSPAAWRSALEKFPNTEAARTWREEAPLEGSWRRKCELIPPLARGEGGVVVFTQFLKTQRALAKSLEGAGVEGFVINGGTAVPERHTITEQFRKRGGALLLTHNGTEGRNLQFCHRLVNFDLPWNPMEIEQRIGRLHRLGQEQPVRIYNFVQAGTLQAHLLEILQEKLNLFELVVGETGLVLGERFSSDEFAGEIFRLWRENEGRVAEALAGLGEELSAAREGYQEVKQLDETLFAQDYESV